MKKLFLILIVLLFAFASTAFALNVGDKMPDVSGFEFQSKHPWAYGGKVGFFVIRDNNPDVQDNVSEYSMAVYLVCDGKPLPLPFAIYLAKDAARYYDYNFDGKVNEVIPVAREKIGSRAPVCPPKKSAVSI